MPVIPRMQKVIDGTDQGGISEAVGWKGGGGFKFWPFYGHSEKKDKYYKTFIKNSIRWLTTEPS